MNEWEIDTARAEHVNHSVLGPATQLLYDLKELANDNSDGWAYWRKPLHAAKKLMAMIQDPTSADEATFKKAQTPIKILCTKYNFAFPSIKGAVYRL